MTKLSNATKATRPESPEQLNSAKEDSVNPFINIAVKRLRTLKKRLAKIEKYQDDVSAGLQEKLNEDQLAAVQKKPEVIVLIKELEEMIKQFEEKEVEEVKIAKKKARIDAAEAQKALNAAVQAVEKVHADGIVKLVSTLITINLALDNVPSTVISKHAKEALYGFYTDVTGFGHLQKSVDFKEVIASAQKVATGFMTESSASYKAIVASASAALDFVVNPPPEPQFTVAAHLEEDQPAVEASLPKKVAALTENVSALSFMTASSILEDPAIISYAGTNVAAPVAASTSWAAASDELQAAQRQPPAVQSNKPPRQDRRPRQSRPKAEGEVEATGGENGGAERRDSSNSVRGKFRPRGRGGYRGGSASAANGAPSNPGRKPQTQRQQPATE